MTSIRKPAVAGFFYPKASQELADTVRTFIAQAQVDSTIPKALIAPHAGYAYSGRVAGTAYAYLKNGAPGFQRIALLGPSHRLPFSGIAASSAEYFETPLGRIPVDLQTIGELISRRLVQVMDSAHSDEHSLEVQLPFLQEVLADFKLVPLVVGRCKPNDLAHVLELLAEDEHTAIVVSSDLSHYLSYQEASERDANTSSLIESLDQSSISSEQACGAVPIRGLLQYVKNTGLKARMVHLANSGDAVASKDSVVGYGAYIFY